MFEQVKAAADRKLAKLGIKLEYKLGRTKLESGTSEKTRTIHLNPADAKYKGLARHDVQHLLLHELGHVFLYNVPIKVKKNPEFALLFGDVIKAYRRRQGRLKASPDFVSTYAQVQPRDDFCETFAVYVHFEGNMPKIKTFLSQRKKSPKALKKVLLIRRLVKNIANI